MALKVLLGSLARNPSVVRRFHAEAQATAPLKHPHIVRIYSAGIEEGTPYIAMEYIHGETLARFLSRKKRVPWQNALYIGHQVALALACAHEHGIVHRDVKPANIMLNLHGLALLTDFGIANVKANNCSQVEEDSFLGTPHYMSPEQCDGGEPTPASDLFSLGVTVYQLISGQSPFEGESTTAIIQSIAHDDPPRLNKLIPEVPDDVARLVAHLLEKKPGDRPQNARAVCETILRVHDQDGGVSAVAAGLAEFVREQTDLHALAGQRQPEKQKRGWRPRGAKQRGGKAERTWRRRFRAVAAVALIVLSTLAFLRWPSNPSIAVASPAPRLEALAFERGRPGELLARLPSMGIRFTDVSWVGDRPVVLVRAEGIEGSLMQGSSGILAIEPGSRTALSLRAPSGPATDPRFWQTRMPAGGYAPIPPAPPDSLAHDAFLVHAYARPPHRGDQQVVTLAQKWDTAAPGPAVLCRTPARQWLSDTAQPWDTRRASRTIVSPDGFTMCIVAHDTARHTNYLVERDIRWETLDRVYPRLTTVDAPIIPESVVYSPEGSHIAYIRTETTGERALWLVPSRGGKVNGALLTMGALGDTAAFSPDGQFIAITVRSAGARDPELVILRARDGHVVAHPGPGRLGKEPWHPLGRYLVVAARDPGAGAGGDSTGTRQLWAVEAWPPHRRAQLTRAEQGVRDICAVARDGAWAVAVLDRDAPPTLVFVDLREVSLDLRT